MKIVIYTPNGNVVSELVRYAIEGEDGRNYKKEVRRFHQKYQRVKVGDSVQFASVEMLVIKVNSGRLKLEVV